MKRFVQTESAEWTLRMLAVFVCVFLLAGGAVAGPGEAEAADGAGAESEAQADVPADLEAAAYLRKCQGCHTIGGGALSGPDLKPVSVWPEDNLRDAIVRMEKNVGPLTAQEVHEFVELLLSPDAAERVSAEQQRRAMLEAAQMEPASAAAGRDLFHGVRGFSNGGISCGACHQAGGKGGNLAVSLEEGFTRLGKEPLMSATLTPGFPVMRAMYTPKPVTRQEAIHIAKYLEEVSQSPQPERHIPMYAAGFAGAAVILTALGRANKGRLRGTRARLVAESQQRQNRGA